MTLRDRILGLADHPADDDDLRLRKRVVVIAGYVLVVAPLQLPVLGQGLALSWVVAVVMLLDAVEEARGAGVPLEVRIGLASGPVVGGIIGQRRILFDLWGDTVNTASRTVTGCPGADPRATDD